MLYEVITTAVRLICDAVKDRQLTESKAEYKKVLADLLVRKRMEIAIGAESKIDHHLLEINVKNGTATLTGQLHSEGERQRVLVLAEATAGISKVIDQIKIVSYRATPRDH